MTKCWNRFVRSAAVALPAAALVALVWSGALAQEQPPGTEGAAEIAALKAQLAALEQKVQRMDDEHSTIRAPFTVVGVDGKQILSVLDEGGRARLTLGNVGGAHVIIGMTGQGSGMSFKDNAGTTRVQIAAGDLSQLWIEDKVATTWLGSSSDGGQTGLQITEGETLQVDLSIDDSGGALKTFDRAGAPIAEISATADTPLLLYDFAGKPFFSVGLPEAGKQILTLGDPAAARVELGLYTGRAGSFVSVIDKSGMQRATMTADPQEYPFSAADDQGNDIFTVGPLDKTGPVQMTVGDASAAHVQLGLFAGENGSFVSALDKSGIQRAALTADDTEPPLSISDDQSRKVFTVGPAPETGVGGPLRLTLGDAEAAHVRIGLFTGEAGSYVSLYDDAAKQRALLTADTKATPLSLFDPQDQPIFTVGPSDATAKPQLVLGTDAGARVQLGVLQTDTGAYLSLYDDGGTERAVISAEASNAFLTLNDSEMRADIGTPADGRPGIVIGKEEKNFATMRFDEVGGFVTVGGASGVGVAGIFSEAEGGAVKVSGADGGVPVGILAAAPGGAKLSLHETGGKARAAITATDVGDFGLYGNGGWLGLNSGKTAPRFEIADASGTVLVQAGIAADKNVGIIQVGPGGNGSASALGNIGLAASQLIGTKK